MRNTVIKKVVLLILVICSASGLQAQVKDIPDLLKTRLVGKTTLSSIMQVVENYYANEGKNEKQDGNDEGETDYQHWKRWEWWMSSHLDGSGKFVSSITKKNDEALTQVERKWGSVMNAEKNAAAGNRQLMQDRENPSGNFAGGGEGTNLSYGDWVSVGPTADGGLSGDIKGLGRIDRIAFHPTNASIIYIGTPSGQLWKTSDGGSNWASVSDAVGALGISGIAISPTNGNVIYILTGDGDSRTPGYLVYDYGSAPECMGVYKSIDGGTTWTKTGVLYAGAGDFEGHRLSISPTNGNFLLAATNQGIYKTTNGGTTWTQVKTGEHWDVKFKPGNDNVVYATSGNSIFYSTTAGDLGTWTTATSDFSTSGSGRINLAVTAANSAYVFAVCGNSYTGGFTGVFRSTNSGVSYVRRCNTPNILGKLEDGSDAGDQTAYDLGITVDPASVLNVATCGLNVWTSSNGGGNFAWSTKYREGYAGAANKYIHPDVHAIEYNPINGYLYAGSDGGIYRSIDDGVSWTNLNTGVATSQFYGMAMQDTNGDGEADGLNLLAGAQDNGIKYRPTGGGSVFGHVICCDGYGVAIAPDNSNNIYFNFNDLFAKSTDGGATVSYPAVGTVTFFSPIAIDFNSALTVYLGGSVTRKTTNGFTSYTSYTGNTSRVITTCPSNSLRLYGSAGNNIIRSDDGAVTWATKSGTAGWPVGTFTINDIEALPTNSLAVYACFGGYSNGNKVMRSTNGGDSWTNWSGSLPNIPTYGLSVSVEGVYVGTEFGVFFRGFAMTDWVPFYNGMPRVPVTEMAVNANGLIYASTFGRGVWLSSRRTACVASLSISGVKNGDWYYEASTNATATLTSPGSVENNVFVQAGDNVVLSPGFEIKSGAFFKGYIAPCGNGGLPTALANGGKNSKVIVPLPFVKEIKPSVKQPVKQAAYFQVVDENFEFNLVKKGILKMMIKTDDGKWASFYPEDMAYPGFYSLRVPKSKSSTEFKFLLNGEEIKQVK